MSGKLRVREAKYEYKRQSTSIGAKVRVGLAKYQYKRQSTSIIVEVRVRVGLAKYEYGRQSTSTGTGLAFSLVCNSSARCL